MRIFLTAMALACAAFAAQQSRTTVLLVNVGPACAVSIASSTVRPDPVNGAFDGEIRFRYQMRTSRGGAGDIHLKALDSGRTLTYTVSLSGAGTPAAGLQTLTGMQPLSVATFGPDAHSSRAGDEGVISWHATGSAPPAWSLGIACQ